MGTAASGSGNGLGPARITAVIAGAQRCATTTLAAELAQHPEVCLALGKEAHLFDQGYVQRDGVSADQLAAVFPHWAGESVVLDATPSYLYLPGALDALVAHSPDVRVIVVLREPGERARSGHGHSRRLGHERWPFSVALALEGRRLRRDPDPLAGRSAAREYSYRDRGRYSDQVGRLLEIVPHVLVLRFDEVIHEPAATLDRVHDFLGVERRGVRTDFVHLNARPDERRRSGAEAWARWSLRADTRATEDLLGWPRGSLAGARVSGRRGRRGRAPAPR